MHHDSAPTTSERSRSRRDISGRARALFEALEHRRMLSSSALALLDADRADEDRPSLALLMPVDNRAMAMLTLQQQARPLAEAAVAAATATAAAHTPAGSLGSPLRALNFMGHRPDAPAADVGPAGGNAMQPESSGHHGNLANPGAQHGFTVYSALRALDDPTRDAAGMVPIHVSYGELYHVNPNGLPDFDRPSESRVRNIANMVGDAGVKWVLNIEQWPVDIRKHSEAEVTETMNKILQIIGWARDERPEVEISLYGVLPLRDYWVPVHLEHYAGKAQQNPGRAWEQQMLQQQQQKVADWHAANDFLRPLADAIDFIAPSLYTFYDDPTAWTLYAEANLAEAARYGKPVLPFVWPQYHDSNTQLVGQFIDGEFWQMQLDKIQAHADGVIIWGDFSLKVDPVNHAWWQITSGFTSSRGVLSDSEAEQDAESPAGARSVPEVVTAGSRSEHEN